MSHTSIEGQVSAVLAGTLPYDSAGADAQAAVRAAWEALIEELNEGLDLEAEFRAEGRASWVTSTPDGRPLVVYADGRPPTSRP